MPTMELCKKSQHTLERIFKRPNSHKLEWPDVIALVQHLGVVEMKPEGEFVFSVNGVSWEFFPSEDENVLNTQQVSDLRDFMKAAGMGKSGLTKAARTPTQRASAGKAAGQEGTVLSPITSREVRLVSRPRGLPTHANFSLVETRLEPLQDGEVLVRNLFLSVDPYMRGRMNDAESYAPASDLGKPLRGGAVGEVLESRAKGFRPGDAILSNFGWREYFIATPAESPELRRVSRKVHPLSLYLGALGMTGMTAWAGLNLVGVKEGDIVYISGAAGAVGNVAGQLAKRRGCYVIGSAGSDEKVKLLQGKFGFDAAFNYKSGPVLESLKAAAPDGIDVYFDNVGGESLEAALATLRPQGRIIACGSISHYNDKNPRCGPSNLSNITANRLTMKGMIVSDAMERRDEFEKEIGGYFRAGKLKNAETRVQGIDHIVEAFLGLFAGKNVGKMVVELTPARDGSRC